MPSIRLIRDSDDPNRNALWERLTAEASDCGPLRRSAFEAQAQYRDQGAPMWAWLTGRRAER